jgi:hypothetical protein
MFAFDTRNTMCVNRDGKRLLTTLPIAWQRGEPED